MSKNERGFIPHHFWLKNGAGFTLLELLVAMVITVLLGAALFNVFNLAGRAWQKGEARTQRYQNLRQALDRMSEEIRSAILLSTTNNPPPKAVKFYGENDYNANGDFLRFISVSKPPRDWAYSGSKKFDCCEIGYHISTDATDDYPLGEPRLMRGISTSNVPDNNVTNFGSKNPLAERITKLDFKYYEADGTEHNTWDSDSSGKLPVKVRIELTAQAFGIAREAKEEIFTTEVWLGQASFGDY